MTEWEMGVLDYSIKGCAWRRRLGFGWVLHIMCAIFCDQESQLHQANEFVFNRNILELLCCPVNHPLSMYQNYAFSPPSPKWVMLNGESRERSCKLNLVAKNGHTCWT